MRYDIRQLSFGEVLDQGFQILKDHFVTLTSITALFYVPYTVAVQQITPGPEAGPPGAEMMMAGGLSILLALVFMPFAQLAITKGVADAYLGKEPSLATAYRAAGRSYLRYLGTSLLMGLALIGLMMLLFVPAVYFGVCWMLVGPVLMVEDISGTASMKRSRALVSGYWWRMVGLMFVATVLTGLVVGGLQLLLGAIPIVGPVLRGLAESISTTFGSIVLIVAYFDLRCRKEDFDLQVLTSDVQAGAGPARMATPG